MEASNCHYVATTPKLSGIGDPSTSCSYYNYDTAGSKKQRQNIIKWNTISIPTSITLKQKLQSASPLIKTTAPSTTTEMQAKIDEDYDGISSSSASSSVISDGNINIANDNDEEDDDVRNHHHNVIDDENNDDDDSENCNEVPIWVRGEPRWISGVTDQTTCYDLIEALLIDEDTFGPLCNELRPRDFVIIERWRKVEQILSTDTKIWKIWSAWGKTQPEVKLSLHHIESHSQLPNNHATSPYLNGLQIGDGDSGRGSPTSSINSAIERRRRHRASKSTSAWLTQAHTVHPKSHKSTIEKLMKLILEQGETIQQQLSKLRDKELQISKIEEEQHQLREKEHGKNYLLETYLNGLHEAIDDREVLTGNSDSGVNTEDTASPDNGLKSNRRLLSTLNDAMSLSERELSLINHHETIKEKSSSKSSDISSCKNDNTLSQIEVLEKLVTLNKKLQHEEELLLRLTVKLRRYECENPMLTEIEIKSELDRINENIQQTSSEQVNTEEQIKIYDEVLKMKSHLLEQLKDEIDYEMEPDAVQDHNSMAQTPDIQQADETGRNNNILQPPPQFSNYAAHQTLPPTVTEQPATGFNQYQIQIDHHVDKNSNNYSLVKSLNLLEKCDQRILNNNNDNNFYLNSNLKIGPKKMIINNNNNNSKSNIDSYKNNNSNIRNCKLLQNSCSSNINMGIPTGVCVLGDGGEFLTIPNSTTISNGNIVNRYKIGSVNGGGYDSNSDTGISSMGEGDMSQLGTLV